MNTNKFHSFISKSLVGVLFISGSLLAAEDGEPERIPVGDRAVTHVEKVKLQEKRAALFQKLENGEDLADEEDLDLSESEQLEIAGQDSAEEQPEASMMKKGFNATTYYTTHEGAFHNPIAVSLLGDTVELEDGSIWQVASSHRHKTLDWFTGDSIIIVPNHDWFSAYDYRLINLNTGANVKVNLSLGPIYNGIYTHWILAVDYVHREICLEDGSVWKMSSLDKSEVNSWLPNDTVIIGINDGWFSGSNPNILINVNMNNYAKGKCIY